MSKKKAQSSQDPFENPEFLRFIREHSQEGIPSGGSIPKGHKGPYKPSKKDVIRGIRIATEAADRRAQAQANVAEEQVNLLFQWEDKQ